MLSVEKVLDLPVIDDHCHAFGLRRETKPFEHSLTLSRMKVDARTISETLLYRMIIKELSRILDVRGSPEKIIETRHEAYQDNPQEYVRLLFDDAKISTMLVDTRGWVPPTEHPTDIDAFRRIVPCKVEVVHRIDGTITRCLDSMWSFDDAETQFLQDIDEAIRHGAVGIKTIVAYGTGLNVEKRPRSEAEVAYARLLTERRSGKSASEALLSRSPHAKALVDHFIFLAARKSCQLRVPFQIHTGTGIDFRLSNPIYLHELIADRELEEAQFVFVHSGYPFVEEVGYIANTFPNVYTDISEMIPFISIGVEEKLLNLFEMTPISKIMYGSDGWGIPELAWISSLLTKRSLCSAFNKLLSSNTIDDEAWAFSSVRAILSENARKLYRLD